MTTERNRDPASISEADKRVRRVELAISTLLRTGVITSLAIVLLGTIISYAAHPDYLNSPADLQQLTLPGAIFPHSWSALGSGLLQLQGQAIIMLGLLLLIATPVARVALSVLAFIYQRDRIYTLITLAVLTLLILSFVLGSVE